MKTVKIVIGANYGDEGKGNVVNYLATPGSAVVRYNGGAQAGHTVIHNGHRHVFHSLGAGTLKGAATILGPEFAVDPIMFFKEVEELDQSLEVYADPRCPIVTPYDVWINQALEKKRSKGQHDKRHGSCGMGFGEAIKRHRLGTFEFTLNQASDDIKDTCDWIEKYFWVRVEELGLDVDIDRGLLDLFCQEVESFVSCVTIEPFGKSARRFEDIIFEGAQGLRLDQRSPDFPHVTFSSTGLDYVLDLLSPFEHVLDIYYVTRTYLTRHGAGEMVGELKDFKIVDETNMPNEYQGSLRFGRLNINRIIDDIRKDLDKADGYHVSKNLMVTCWDQLDHEQVIQDISFIRSELEMECQTCWGPDGPWRGFLSKT